MTRSWVSACAIVGIALAAPASSMPGKEEIKVSSATAMKGATQVAVAAFNVGFIFESIDSTAATGGLIGAFGGTTRAKSKLVGVTPEMMQAITDAAYVDFRAQMAAGGFTLVDAAADHASLAKLKPLQAPHTVSLTMGKGDKGRITYLKPSVLARMVTFPGDIMQTGFGGIGPTMTATGNMMAFSNYAKATGQAVVDVVYVIDFSNAKRPGAFSFGLGSVQVNSNMAVVGGGVSKLTMLMPSGKSTVLALQQPIAVEGDFATMEDATKDKGLQSAANVAGGALAVMGLGGLNFGKSRTFIFTVKSEAYNAGATKAATLANQRMMARLAALR